MDPYLRIMDIQRQNAWFVCFMKRITIQLGISFNSINRSQCCRNLGGKQKLYNHFAFKLGES